MSEPPDPRHIPPVFHTLRGLPFDLDAPWQAEITLDDIASVLSRIYRWNGHAREQISVAQHSVMVAWVAPGNCWRHALLHDAHEYVVGDWTRPVKALLRYQGVDFDRIVAPIDRAIYSSLGLEPMPGPYVREAVKWADDIVNALERHHLMPGDWPMPEMGGGGVAWAMEKMVGWTADVARDAFLDTWEKGVPPK